MSYSLSDDPITPAPFQPDYDPTAGAAPERPIRPIAGSAWLRARLAGMRQRWGLVGLILILLVVATLFALPGGTGPLTLFNPSSSRPDDPITVAPLIGAVIGDGQSLAAPITRTLNLVLVEGAAAQSDGSLDTAGLNVANRSNADYALLLVVKPPADHDAAALLNDSATRRALTSSITALLQEGTYRGVVLDFGLLDKGQASDLNSLVRELAGQFGNDWLLGVRVPTPMQNGGLWDTGAYDWRWLSAQADLLIVTPPGGPDDYVEGGLTDRFFEWARTRVDSVRLYPAFSALSVDEWGGQLNPIPYDYALAPLGVVGLNPDNLAAAQHPEPGQALTFELYGTAAHIDRDQQSGLYYYEVYGSDGLRRVWLMTPAALRARLGWIASHGVGGIILLDLFDEQTAGGLLTALQEFKLGQPSTLASELHLEWTIREADGPVIAQMTTDLGESITWTPENEGNYLISASLPGVGFSDRGALPLIVGGQTVGIAPAQEGVVAGAPDSPPPTPASGQGGLLAPLPEDMPPPVYPAGALGNFELGGQVNHVIEHPGYMRQAGMTWVKFQLAWAEDLDSSVVWELIERGRKEKFKVLISVTGREKYPSNIDVPKFQEFLEGVAYYGADAIEVWNEPNIDYEWPRGRIDGARYVRELLAPAYNSIKSVNPHVMVISAAPAPTGAYFGEGGCSLQGYGCDDWLFLQQMAQAGAANYMDCVGAHYNSGATSPTQTTGHPADPGYGHYSWYFPGMLQLYGGTFGHRVCFTELGYLSGAGLGTVPDRFDWARDTSVADQAQWLAEAVQLSRDSGLVRLLIVWNVDFTYWGDDPMAGYAIVRPDESCPACAALGEVMP